MLMIMLLKYKDGFEKSCSRKEFNRKLYKEVLLEQNYKKEKGSNLGKGFQF
jgi:hypothetical protein